MDSTPNPNPNPSQLSINPSTARKLPIKRKNPYSSTPSSNPNPNFTPKFDSTGDEPPPFKFHRIWTEPDEIRFLHGLLACSTEGLLFPRDLNVFYARFSGTMSQPYTKSQLSEKLRRLRKKFRVISSRLAKGLGKEILSPHDRSLYELSKQLWHPDYSDTSPFGNGYGKGSKFSLPNYTVVHELNDNDNEIVSNCVDNDDNDNDNNLENCVDNEIEEVKLREVNVEFEDGEELLVASGSGTGIVKIAAKAAIDVFDQSLKEVSISLVHQGLLNMENCGSVSKEVKEDSIEKRWRQQCVAELDVLARRLRLVVEHSLQRG